MKFGKDTQLLYSDLSPGDTVTLNGHYCMVIDIINEYGSYSAVRLSTGYIVNVSKQREVSKIEIIYSKVV